MITVEDLEEQGLGLDANNLRLFLLYNPQYENHVIGYNKIYLGYIFYIDDGSKTKFDLIDKSFLYYPPGYKDEDRTKDEVNYDIARNIRRAMYLKGKNQKDLAQACGLSQGTISNYLAGNRTDIPVWALLRIARYLSINVSQLYLR